MSDENALFGLENPARNGGMTGNFGQGSTETDTRTALAEIEDGTPFTGSKRTIKQLCIALAMSIDKGNTKGRAIANEAAQLFAMMTQLDPTDGPELGSSTLDPETERLFNGFASGPRLETDPAAADAAPRDYEAEL